MATKSSHYVNNTELLKAIIQYKKDVKQAKKDGKPKPRIPDYVGKCILLIAENLAHKPNFNGFTWKDEMIGDGIENCMMYFDNFNPNKSKNPFAYFTQIIYYAFLRRILKEKKQLYSKYKVIEQHSVLGDMEHDEDMVNNQFELYDNISDFIGKFEDSKNMKKKKKKKVNLDLIIEDSLNTGE